MATPLPDSPPPPYSSCVQQPRVVHLQPYPVVIPEYQPTNVTFQAITVRPPGAFILGGGCPACHIGTIEEGFTCLGILCAILLFPLGIVCCLCIRRYRCTDCGTSYGEMFLSNFVTSKYQVMILIALFLIVFYIVRLCYQFTTI